LQGLSAADQVAWRDDLTPVAHLVQRSSLGTAVSVGAARHSAGQKRCDGRLIDFDDQPRAGRRSSDGPVSVPAGGELTFSIGSTSIVRL
jgi:hypothetical protein